MREPCPVNGDASAVELCREFRLPTAGGIDLGVHEPVDVARKLDTEFVQDSDLLSPDEAEEEPHLEHDILSCAGSLILGGEFFGASKVIAGEEHDREPCAAAVLLQLLDEYLPAVRLLMKDGRLLTRHAVEERREFELAGIVAAVDDEDLLRFHVLSRSGGYRFTFWRSRRDLEFQLR